MKSNINFCILPECYLDTNLLETIAPPDRIGGTCGYNHKHSCNKVIDEMLGKLKDDFAIGFVDKDKVPLSRINNFDLKIEKKISENIYLKLYKHNQKHQYLIFHPPLEQWIIDEARSVNISLADYNLPTKLKKYKDKNGKFINGLVDEKGVLSKNDKRFKNLFLELIKKEAISIKLLAGWIRYLKTHPFDANIEELKNQIN